MIVCGTCRSRTGFSRGARAETRRGRIVIRTECEACGAEIRVVAETPAEGNVRRLPLG